MSKVDFNHGKKTSEFLLTLHEVFPLIEHFLREEDWATILFFLSEKKTELKELKKIQAALIRCDEKIGQYYPQFVQNSTKISKRYTLESALAPAIYNLSQILKCLSASADDFILAMECGKNPNSN